MTMDERYREIQRLIMRGDALMIRARRLADFARPASFLPLGILVIGLFLDDHDRMVMRHTASALALIVATLAVIDLMMLRRGVKHYQRATELSTQRMAQNDDHHPNG